MKKLLLLIMICLMSTLTYARGVPCTAHYTLVILEEGMPDRHIHVEVTSSGGCASALEAARSMALLRYNNAI